MTLVPARWWASLFMPSCLLLLYLASTPAVARWAAWTLERQHPPVAVERLPAADAILVLGGAMHAMRQPDGSLHLFSRGASDPFEAGVGGFQAGGAPSKSAESTILSKQLRTWGA
jgi:uncharacterized SAM-binding protein YcdF (DUF218 family)